MLNILLAKKKWEEKGDQKSEPGTGVFVEFMVRKYGRQ